MKTALVHVCPSQPDESAPLLGVSDKLSNTHTDVCVSPQFRRANGRQDDRSSLSQAMQACPYGWWSHQHSYIPQCRDRAYHYVADRTTTLVARHGVRGDVVGGRARERSSAGRGGDSGLHNHPIPLRPSLTASSKQRVTITGVKRGKFDCDTVCRELRGEYKAPADPRTTQHRFAHEKP